MTTPRSAAIKAFFSHGFDKIGQVELFMDLKPEAGKKWIKGPGFYGTDFLH
ncbi:MAG: hypothetical protein JW874_11115 [Spirochaetales bacterium]|nr:hypothetical protein [Spirochaetales bacterium]